MKLYEIDQAIEACIDWETGEILDSQALDALQMERTAKLEGVACWVKNLEAEADALKAEKDNLAKREKAARNKAESLKNWLAYALQGEKLTTAKAAISFRKSESVEIPNQDLFVIWASDEHNHLLSYKQPEPKMKAIKEALKAGIMLPGARLVERQNIQIK